MLSNIYYEQIDKRWVEKPLPPRFNYTGMAIDKTIKMSRLLALLLLLIAEDSSNEEEECFNSLMAIIAMYLECDGYMKICATQGHHDLIVSANDELLTMLTSSDYSDMLD